MGDETSAAVTRLRAIANPDDIIVGILLFLEGLQGARDEALAAQIETAVRAVQFEDMLDDQPTIKTARLYPALRASAPTPSRTIDAIIFSFCIRLAREPLNKSGDPRAAQSSPLLIRFARDWTDAANDSRDGWF